MDHITLNSQQLDVVSRAHDPVAVRDESGNLRGYIAMVITDLQLADARRALASQERRYTTGEVLASLRSQGTP